MHTPREVAHAVAVLRGGGLVAFPTETVYGLGADAANRPALARLYEVKGRPADHPVIVHIGDAMLLDELASVVTEEARTLAAACWPGPLTLVVRRRPERVPDEVTGGRDSVGVRVPAQPLALELLAAFGGGVAAPSANRFGRVSPTTADDVRADLGSDVDLVVDGGPCAVGVESTIVDCTGSSPVILRLGGLQRERVEEIVGAPVPVRDDRPAPGTMPAHYAPTARVVLATNADAPARVADELAGGRAVAVLAEKSLDDLPEGVVVLEPPSDPDDYARVLYRRLRDADERGLDVVVAVPPAAVGIGAAVVDRLRRAAASSR